MTKVKQARNFFAQKNCGIIVSADCFYSPKQPKNLTINAATTKEGAKIEAAAVEVKVKSSLSMTQLSRKPASMKEMIKQLDQQCEETEKRIEELEDQVSNLMSENTGKEEMIHWLNKQMRQKTAQINQQLEQLSTNEGACVENFDCFPRVSGEYLRRELVQNCSSLGFMPPDTTMNDTNVSTLLLEQDITYNCYRLVFCYAEAFGATGGILAITALCSKLYFSMLVSIRR